MSASLWKLCLLTEKVGSTKLGLRQSFCFFGGQRRIEYRRLRIIPRPARSVDPKADANFHDGGGCPGA